MWLGLALVLWLWGLALYLAIYYFAVWKWGALGLYERLGQDFYNAHVPGGGWEAVWIPTLVFLATLAILGASGRPVRAAAGWLSRRARVPTLAGAAAVYGALIAVAVPTVHAGIVGGRDAIRSAVRNAQRQEAELRVAEVRSHDLFFTGADMVQPVEAFQYSTGLTRERLLLAANGVYRRTWSGCAAGSRHEGRYRQEGLLVLLEEPYDNFGDSNEHLSMRLHDVRWGERRYLIADSDPVLLGFCNAVNAGDEPVVGRPSWCLLRDGDEHRDASGLPALPDRWPEFVLSAPLSGSTTRTLEDGTAWVNLGLDDGVHEGLQLWLPEMPLAPEIRHRWGGATTTIEPVKVVEVETRRCRVGSSLHRGWTVPAGLVVTSRHPPGD